MTHDTTYMHSSRLLRRSSAVYQGLTLVHVRAQLEQLQDTFRVKLGYTVDRRAQVELKSERV
jgi:hypothetical protein